MKQVKNGFSLVAPGMDENSRWKVDGDSANFMSDGRIEVLGVRAQVVDDKGRVNKIYAEKAYVDRSTGKVETDVFVRMSREGLDITGTGLVWEPDKKIIHIEKDVRIVMKSDARKESQE